MAESRRDPDAEQVLGHHQAGGEEAVLRPHLPDGLPAPAANDGDQGAGVQQGIQVHPLANHIHRHHKAHLGEPMRCSAKNTNGHTVPKSMIEIFYKRLKPPR